MNKVAGKILVKETGLGVPNLLVVIYDIDPKPLPDDTGNFIDWGVVASIRGPFGIGNYR